MQFQRLCLFAFLGLFLGGCADPLLSGKIDPAGNLSRKDYTKLRHRGAAQDAPESSDETTESAPPPAAAPLTPVTPAVQPATPTPPAATDKRVSLTVTEDVPLRDVLLELGRAAHVNMEIDPRITGSLIFTATDQPFHAVLRRLCDAAGLRARTNGAFVRVELDDPYAKTYPLDFPNFSRQTSSEVSIATNVFDADVANTSGGGNRSGGANANNNSTAKIMAQSNTDFWSDLEKSLTRLLAANSTGSHRHSDENAAVFTLDRQAGLITLIGTDKQHKAIETYLNHLRQKSMTQVLIEARIVEVELSDAFLSGINWQSVLSQSGPAATLGLSAINPAASATNGLFTASVKGGDFSGLLNLVRTFGTTRILSSPRLTVLNNQNAVLKVARNEVYFITSAQYSTTVNASGVAVSGSPVFTSTPHTVPVGLIMTVQPAINADKGLVTMTLRPTISRIVDHVSDPSIGLNAAEAGLSNTVESKIPVLAVREMDSVLQMHSGEVVIMGGLMQDQSDNTDQGLPPFDNIPVLGNLFKSRNNNASTSELVILLRATILDRAAPDAADADLYQNYNEDPRPLPLPLSTLSN